MESDERKEEKKMEGWVFIYGSKQTLSWWHCRLASNVSFRMSVYGNDTSPRATAFRLNFAVVFIELNRMCMTPPLKGIFTFTSEFHSKKCLLRLKEFCTAFKLVLNDVSFCKTKHQSSEQYTPLHPLPPTTLWTKTPLHPLPLPHLCHRPRPRATFLGRTLKKIYVIWLP